MDAFYSLILISVLFWVSFYSLLSYFCLRKVFDVELMHGVTCSLKVMKRVPIQTKIIRCFAFCLPDLLASLMVTYFHFFTAELVLLSLILVEVHLVDSLQPNFSIRIFLKLKSYYCGPLVLMPISFQFFMPFQKFLLTVFTH